LHPIVNAVAVEIRERHAEPVERIVQLLDDGRDAPSLRCLVGRIEAHQQFEAVVRDDVDPQSYFPASGVARADEVIERGRLAAAFGALSAYRRHAC